MGPSQYEAVIYLSQWTFWLMFIVPSGATATVVYFSVLKIFNPDETESCNSKIKNTLYASVIMFSISGFIALVSRFYK